MLEDMISGQGNEDMGDAVMKWSAANCVFDFLLANG